MKAIRKNVVDGKNLVLEMKNTIKKFQNKEIMLRDFLRKIGNLRKDLDLVFKDEEKVLKMNNSQWIIQKYNQKELT